jgi:hypothetical protein
MPLPAEGLSSIQEFVGSLNADMPPDMAGRMRYETRVYRNAVTLVEIAPLDFQTPGSREFEVPFARLRFTRSQGWELFWSDRNSEFHVYDLVGVSQNSRWGAACS